MNKDLSSMTRAELEKLKVQVEKALVEVAEKDKKADNKSYRFMLEEI